MKDLKDYSQVLFFSYCVLPSLKGLCRDEFPPNIKNYWDGGKYLKGPVGPVPLCDFEVEHS